MAHDSPLQKRPKKLLDQVREAMRLKHYAYRTEETYVQWIRRYILFHNKRHPKEMGRPEIEAFLTDLAVNQQVAASTQNQALNAVLFLYHKVLGIEIVGINAVRANQPRNLPVVLTKAEALAMIQKIDGPHQLVVKLLYGSGLRLSEALRLRIKDLDFAQKQITVRDGKGANTVELSAYIWQFNNAGNDFRRGREELPLFKSPNHPELSAVSRDDWDQCYPHYLALTTTGQLFGQGSG
jgi:integrase